MKISARDQWTGKVAKVVKGPVSAEATPAVAPGIDVVAVIGTSSADALGLAAAKSATAVDKASSVPIAVD